MFGAIRDLVCLFEAYHAPVFRSSPYAVLRASHTVVRSSATLKAAWDVMTAELAHDAATLDEADEILRRMHGWGINGIELKAAHGEKFANGPKHERRDALTVAIDGALGTLGSRESATQIFTHQKRQKITGQKPR
jgi:hypothetical protein